MSQQKLFESDIYEAVADAVTALGGAKRVGHMLWPAKPIEEAGRQLNRCLSSTNDNKLSLEELLLIMERAADKGCHTIADHIGQRAGYAFQRITPEQKERDLQDAIVRQQAELIERLAELKALHERRGLRVAS